jgi:hypothetical protein
MFSKFQSLPSYFGGKRKLVKYIFKPIEKKEGVFIDAFLGGGSVSLYAKAKGYKVISNDIAYRSLIIGKTIIANNSVKLESEDLARLFIETKHDGFIKKNYCQKVFTTKIADFLDNAIVAARQVENETKRYLLLHLIIKFILSCRQFGKFTHTRDTLDLEARKWEWPLRSKSHAQKNLRMIQNPIYYGVFSFNGEIYDGTHEPIISKKLFDFVQQVMSNRGKKKRKRKHEFAFSGLMKCGNCDCLITAETQKGHNYLRCTKRKNPCSQRYAREDAITSQIKEKIKKVSLSSAWANASINYFENEKMKIENKAENLLDLFIGGKGIEPEEYQAKKSKLLNEKQDILEKIKDFEQKGNNWLEPMKEMILASSQAKILLSQSDNQEIRAFLKNIGSNFILKDKKFQFALKIGWRALAEGEPTKTFPNWRATSGWNRGRSSPVRPF